MPAVPTVPTVTEAPPAAALVGEPRQGRRSRGGTFGSTSSDSPPARVVTTRVTLRADSSPLDDDVDDDIELADERTGAACSRLLSDRSAVQQAEGAVIASQTALDAAEERERTDRASGDVTVQNAQQQVVTAQNQLATAGNDRPQDIAAQRAQVEDARAAVAIARRDVDETVITAPAAGTVTAINGNAGEVVSPPSLVTALAPGGTAPLPATSGGTGTGTGGTTPGAGAFLTLDAADSFQVVVPFEEADAARIVPGQPVQVTVDALPNDTLTGRVVSVAPSGVDLSGIVSYYATVVVDGGADRLRDGQTAEANVRVEVGGQRAAGARGRRAPQRRSAHGDGQRPGRGPGVGAVPGRAGGRRLRGGPLGADRRRPGRAPPGDRDPEPRPGRAAAGQLIYDTVTDDRYLAAAPATPRVTWPGPAGDTTSPGGVGWGIAVACGDGCAGTRPPRSPPPPARCSARWWGSGSPDRSGPRSAATSARASRSTRWSSPGSCGPSGRRPGRGACAACWPTCSGSSGPPRRSTRSPCARSRCTPGRSSPAAS